MPVTSRRHMDSSESPPWLSLWTNRESSQHQASSGLALLPFPEQAGSGFDKSCWASNWLNWTRFGQWQLAPLEGPGVEAGGQAGCRQGDGGALCRRGNWGLLCLNLTDPQEPGQWSQMPHRGNGACWRLTRGAREEVWSGLPYRGSILSRAGRERSGDRVLVWRCGSNRKEGTTTGR